MTVVDVYMKKCRRCGNKFRRYQWLCNGKYKQNCFQCDPQSMDRFRPFDYNNPVIPPSLPLYLSDSRYGKLRNTINCVGPIIDIIKPTRRILHWKRVDDKYILESSTTTNYLVLEFTPKYDCIIEDDQLIIPTPNTFYQNSRRNALILFALKKLSFRDNNIDIIKYIKNSHPLLIATDYHPDNWASTTFNMWSDFRNSHQTMFGCKYINYIPK